MRLLIVSTLDSSRPFGSFERPFHLGRHLTQYFEVFQLGFDCSAVDYGESVSVGSRSLTSYIKSIHKCIDEFHPDVVYAQETLPGLAALISLMFRKQEKCSLVFDFHTLSAFEYWTRLPYTSNRLKEFSLFIKTYIAQGVLIVSGKPIIVAGDPIKRLMTSWYRGLQRRIYVVDNGVPEDIMITPFYSIVNPYLKIKPSKIVAVIAPKTFQFPTNDMAVSLTIQAARHLESQNQKIHIVVIGRDAEKSDKPLPANITFVGFLPKRSDLIAHLDYADVCLLPFPKQAVAGGARQKAHYYFARKKLVVSTPEGLRGLEEYRDRQHLLVSGYSVEELANTLVDACTNLESYQSLAEAAYKLTKEKYSWSAMAEKVAEILNKEKNA